jgi:hypothetical protein
VKGAGSASSISNYQFTDPDPIRGTVYYRLQQYDFDGRSEFSKTISLNMEDVSFTVAPNPFNSETGLTVIKSPDEKIQIKIMDITGKTVFECHEFNSVETLQIGENFQPGMYFINVVSRNKIFTGKLIKR